MLFDRYDSIRIVSLPERSDRRRFMSRQLRKLGLAGDSRVAYFDGIRKDDSGPFLKAGSHGSFLSHLAILKEASRAGCSVLILQDDCEFLPEIRSFERPDCDIFYGGYRLSTSGEPQLSDIIGAHFMGFSAQAAQKAADYLERYLKPDFPPDEKAASQSGFDPCIRPPIDGAFVWFRRAHPELRTEFALLSKQRSSRSDVSPGRLDKLPGVRRLVAVAREIRRLLGKA
jgi:glycosyl transferase family 25